VAKVSVSVVSGFKFICKSNIPHEVTQYSKEDLKTRNCFFISFWLAWIVYIKRLPQLLFLWSVLKLDSIYLFNKFIQLFSLHRFCYPALH